MSGSAHLVMGVFTGTLIVYMANPTPVEGMVVVGSTAVASLVPDFDTTHSKIGWKFPLISFFINFIFGHRGFLHSPLLLIILYLLFRGELVGIGIIAGYAGHLLQDLFTSGGIPAFYPYKKRYSLLKVKTGGLSDWITTMLIMSAIIMCIKLQGLM